MLLYQYRDKHLGGSTIEFHFESDKNQRRPNDIQVSSVSSLGRNFRLEDDGDLHTSKQRTGNWHLGNGYRAVEICREQEIFDTRAMAVNLFLLGTPTHCNVYVR